MDSCCICWSAKRFNLWNRDWKLANWRISNCPRSTRDHLDEVDVRSCFSSRHTGLTLGCRLNRVILLIAVIDPLPSLRRRACPLYQLHSFSEWLLAFFNTLLGRCRICWAQCHMVVYLVRVLWRWRFFDGVKSLEWRMASLLLFVVLLHLEYDFLASSIHSGLILIRDQDFFL